MELMYYSRDYGVLLPLRESADDTCVTRSSRCVQQCTIHGGLNQTVQSISECVAMAEAVPKCHKMTQRACIDSHDYTECVMAESYCQETLGSSFLRAGVNP